MSVENLTRPWTYAIIMDFKTPKVFSLTQEKCEKHNKITDLQVDNFSEQERMLNTLLENVLF
jgi:hypothetical protein